MSFVPAIAYHVCLNLPEKILQPWVHFKASPVLLDQCSFHPAPERGLDSKWHVPNGIPNPAAAVAEQALTSRAICCRRARAAAKTNQKMSRHPISKRARRGEGEENV